MRYVCAAEEKHTQRKKMGLAILQHRKGSSRQQAKIEYQSSTRHHGYEYQKRKLQVLLLAFFSL